MYRWSCLLVLVFVMPGSIHAATLHVPSEYPTIQEAIDAAAYGDTVEVACGTHVEHGIEMRSGICLRSETGDPDCLSLFGYFYCTDVDEMASIEGILMYTANQRVVTCERSSLAFTNCVFTWCSSGAVSLTDSSPSFVHCRFEENHATWDGAALHATDSHPTLVDCFFDRNAAEYFGAALFLVRGGATLVRCSFWGGQSMHGTSIDAWNSSIEMRNCTTYWEHGCAPVYLDGGSQALLENCIIAFCPFSHAVWCEGGSEATLRCCNLYGNAGDWDGYIEDQYGANGNISEDPLFCDPENHDLTLECASPCAPFSPPNPECDLIGAWPIGCGGTSVSKTTWGAMKALFRE